MWWFFGKLLKTLLLISGTAFIISHGWIIDGLVVARYGKPLISSLLTRRPLTIFLLGAGDEIKAVSGENCRWDGTTVVGKIEIETMNGLKFGPFGHCGDPAHSYQGYSSFNVHPNNLQLKADQRFGKFLGPIGNSGAPPQPTQSSSGKPKIAEDGHRNIVQRNDVQHNDVQRISMRNVVHRVPNDDGLGEWKVNGRRFHNKLSGEQQAGRDKNSDAWDIITGGKPNPFEL